MGQIIQERIKKKFWRTALKNFTSSIPKYFVPYINFWSILAVLAVSQYIYIYVCKKSGFSTGTLVIFLSWYSVYCYVSHSKSAKFLGVFCNFFDRLNQRGTFRSSHQEVFLRKGFLKTCSQFTREHPCRSVISIKFLL